MNEMEVDFDLSSAGRLSQVAWRKGFKRFAALTEYVKELPYGRVVGTSPAAVLEEQRGTCSSKHALLALIAREANRLDVELTVGLYEMNERNTPGVGEALARHGLMSVPEAHCYLRVKERRFDFTGLPAGAASPFDSLFSEERIDPEAVATIKPALHLAAIQRWSQERGLDPAAVWRAREEGISRLAEQAALR
jgi:hypothetical protein